jgi:diaminopimelate epimerase
MTLRFTKMHGLGNDFIVIDAIGQTVALAVDQIRAMADRRFGIGCDQLLLIEPPRSPGTEFYYRIFNADGGEVEQCGNGARCFARYVHDRGLTTNRDITVGTAAGPINLYLDADDTVRVNMGAPRLTPSDIPFDADPQALSYALLVDDQALQVGAVSMGNPHAVLQVDDVAVAPVETLGPRIESHPRFPQRTNVGFMAVRDRSAIDLRVYERGSGETLACGTGACAAVVHGRRLGLLDERVAVSLPGGTLVISWLDDANPVWMRGPASFVFDGVVDLAGLTGLNTGKTLGATHEPATG